MVLDSRRYADHLGGVIVIVFFVMILSVTWVLVVDLFSDNNYLVDVFAITFFFDVVGYGANDQADIGARIFFVFLFPNSL